MERKYIVIHVNDRAGIVYKDSIEAILPYNDVEELHAEIRLHGTSIYTDDKYEDVVKQMFA